MVSQENLKRDHWSSCISNLIYLIRKQNATEPTSKVNICNLELDKNCLVSWTIVEKSSNITIKPKNLFSKAHANH